MRRPQITRRAGAGIATLLSVAILASDASGGRSHPGSAAATGAAAQAPQDGRRSAARDEVRALRDIRLSFQPNRGQAPRAVRFLAQGAGHCVQLTRTQIALVPRDDRRRAALRLRFAGADRHAAMSPLRRLAGRVSYLRGRDPSGWITGIPTYASVRYRGLWPGIDAIFYGTRRHELEYDFVIAPGADPSAIGLRVGGARSLRIDTAGDLLLGVAGGVVRQRRPVAYQRDRGGARRAVAARYTLGDGRRVGLRIAHYDRSKPLVVDPILGYATYLGGSGAEHVRDIAIDAQRNVYIAGSTSSSNLPTASAVQSAFAGGATDAFVTKLDATGDAPVYTTYLGGNGDDAANAIALDGAGNAYVAGSTSSANFPLAGARQPAYAGGASDAFVAKLTADGSALTYSTYHGGSGLDEASSAAVDAAGSLYVTGETSSPNLPTVSPFRATLGLGGSDAFVTKFDPAASALAYSTYLGGHGYDRGVDIAVDAGGHAYVAGTTIAEDFPTVNPVQAAHGAQDEGIYDAFVTKLQPGGSTLAFSTYLGGAANDEAAGIAVDAAGVYVTGNTESTNFPTLNAFQPANAGGYDDAFVTKLASGSGAIAYSTYTGGPPASPDVSKAGGEDVGRAIAVDAHGSAYVAGYTASSAFPLANPFQVKATRFDHDAFVLKLAPAGTALVYSTLLGGRYFEDPHGLALDASANAYVAGDTESPDFPLAGAAQPAYGGGTSDGFVAKIDSSDELAPQTDVLSGPPALTISADASLTLSTSEPGPGARFVCSLDGAAFGACGATPSYAGLTQGSHTFAARAIDAFNNADPTPATRAWIVDSTPPVAALTASPNPALAGSHITFDAAASHDLGSAIVGFEWDLDGDGAFETDTGESQKTMRSFADPGTYAARVRVTDSAGLTSVARVDERIVPDPRARPAATVSINDGARYTNSTRVTLNATWPSFASRMLVANDGGFSAAVSLALAPSTAWTLASAGAERLPKIVYVRFVRGLTVSDVYTDDITLDLRPPAVIAASLTRAKGAGPPLLRVRARDRGPAGVSRVQVANDRRRPLTSFRAYRAMLKLAPRRGERRINARERVYVRVRDRAGNVSAWRPVRRR